MYLDALAKLGVGGAHPGGLLLTEKLVRSEQISTNTRILDIGCGTGQTSAYLYHHFKCQVIACDIHPLMLEKANKRFQQESLPIKAIYGNSEALPFQDDTFDIIISESVTSFTNIKRSLKEYYRVLKPKGMLIAIEMTQGGALPIADIEKIKNFYTLEKVMTKEGWQQELEECSFSQIKIDLYVVKSPNPNTLCDIDPSPSIDTKTNEVIMEHAKLLSTYQTSIFPCIIIAQK
ncbi:class I SAM-dependent methyltransferase [Alkalihalobacterium elongatum]|uniref:class I SAM-dependent methyltransferase n=1 Tax=Alkalihalobacterium elongatum TaxID=2675466 RepID=UPI001C1F96D0|nr:class I SAM-dependent methyltransferase [Alkalihalobacterium elongatum]